MEKNEKRKQLISKDEDLGTVLLNKLILLYFDSCSQCDKKIQKKYSNDGLK